MNGREVIFCKKVIPFIYTSLLYNNSEIKQTKIQKHFDLNLDQSVTFQYHVNEKIKKSFERSCSTSQVATYFISNIPTDYL